MTTPASSKHRTCPTCKARAEKIKELQRLLKYATVYSNLATLFPESFLKDAMEALK